MQTVLIGIQARSGSTRLPRKAFELISGRMMLDRVIDNCKKAGLFISKKSNSLRVRIAVLTPYNDPIISEFKSRCEIVEGPEDDVLARYAEAERRYNPNYIVRITGDCPLLPPFVISKAIKLAMENGYDYVSNVDPQYRTSLDGMDCEVVSAALLKYLDKTAVSPGDREHVTTFARSAPPDWAKIGCIVNYFDQSGTKLSVDTKEDLEAVRTAFSAADGKYQEAVLRFGRQAVHRL